MIIPTKHLKPQDTLLASGGIVLQSLDAPSSVSELWSTLRDNPIVASYERLVLTLDLLFVLEAIDYADGIISRRRT